MSSEITNIIGIGRLSHKKDKKTALTIISGKCMQPQSSFAAVCLSGGKKNEAKRDCGVEGRKQKEMTTWRKKKWSEKEWKEKGKE